MPSVGSEAAYINLYFNLYIMTVNTSYFGIKSLSMHICVCFSIDVEHEKQTKDCLPRRGRQAVFRFQYGLYF